MKLLKAFAISFSLYSKIPMPQFEWQDEDMKYSLIFFPLVGLVIGAVCACIFMLGKVFGMSDLVVSLLMTSVPLLITGGFHVDGFMDVEDALKSYGTKEKKLEIMKDPHIGAFAVIRLATLGLIYLAAILLIIQNGEIQYVYVYSLGFVMARALSGIGVLKLPKAKPDGMLIHESKVNGEGVFKALVIELVLCILAGFLINLWAGMALTVSGLVSFVFYICKSKKEFGGVTGDTAGYFLVICETLVVVCLAVVICILG